MQFDINNTSILTLYRPVVTVTSGEEEPTPNAIGQYRENMKCLGGNSFISHFSTMLTHKRISGGENHYIAGITNE